MLNLLHILAAATLAGCLVVLSGEARGVSRSRGYLMVPPVLAAAAALLTIGLTEPDLRQPQVLRLAIGLGAAVGVVRGWFMTVDIDPLWSTVRLPTGRDGFWMAAALVALLLAATAAPLIASGGAELVPYASAAVAFGAGFLSGRAALVYLRTRG